MAMRDGQIIKKDGNECKTNDDDAAIKATKSSYTAYLGANTGNCAVT